MRRERIEAILKRIRPLLLADGFNIELIGTSQRGATIRLTKVPSEYALESLNRQLNLQEVLRQEIEGFGELRVLVERHS